MRTPHRRGTSQESLTNSNASRKLLSRDFNAHKVLALPGLNGSLWSTDSFAGFISINSALNSNLFYWLFEAETDASSRPLIIWLNGGPGCSSMDGLFLELGPFRLSGDAVALNTHSW